MVEEKCEQKSPFFETTMSEADDAKRACPDSSMSVEACFESCEAPCTAGEEYDRASFECVACPVGTHSRYGTACEPCSAGTHADVTGLAECKPCNADRQFTSNDDGTGCVCRAGTYEESGDCVERACGSGGAECKVKNRTVATITAKKGYYRFVHTCAD